VAKWRLKWYPGIRQLLRQLPDGLRQETAEVIGDLAFDPYPAYAEPLRRELSGYYKIKLRDWRIIYTVNEPDQIVFIRDVRQRNRNTYLNL
jgi:mRNA-degrading endonuclease RelE of RelBE toxin-antitoxin system